MANSSRNPCFSMDDSAVLVHGDNLAAMEALLPSHAGRFRLVTIDPPFDTGQTWRTVEGEVAYRDVFRMPYLEMMEKRLVLIRELLAEDGSLLLHCDSRRSHHLAVLCDKVFGMGARGSDPHAAGFRNEIVWMYGLGGSSPRYYPRKHDTIFWYTRGRDWVFHPPMVAATSQRMAGQQKKCPDTWDIPSLNNMAKERTGYPTQKPEALLERILRAHSEPGDLVADFFCGSGTALVVAAREGRRWVGCDASDVAIDTAGKRLGAAGVTFRRQRLVPEEPQD